MTNTAQIKFSFTTIEYLIIIHFIHYSPPTSHQTMPTENSQLHFSMILPLEWRETQLGTTWGANMQHM